MSQALLHFVIVGGGPTSVECAAEMHDFVAEDVRKWFPELRELVKSTLVEAGNQLLGSFDSSLSSYVAQQFQKRRINVRTEASVARNWSTR